MVASLPAGGVAYVRPANMATRMEDPNSIVKLEPWSCEKQKPGGGEKTKV